jgi:Macrocin-O-methyltransferase (TylF)
MRKTMLQSFKQFLTIVGVRMSAPGLHQLQMVVNYLALGHWMTENSFHIRRRVPDRSAVFAAVAEQVRDKHILYLEFGVFRGASMRYWSNALKNPETRLHGFDSFEGLPEDFDVDGPYMKGTFNVDGEIPQIDDSRVQFFKGWFDEVLPTYQLPEYEALVIVLDADLYSSTLYVLNHLRPFIMRGTFIYFDDMSRPDHEPRAFKAFMKESGLKFRLVSADYSLNTAFFECVK